LDPDRIKAELLVKNWERRSPRLTPPPQPQLVYRTPQKQQEIEALQVEIERGVSPSTRVGVAKLAHAATIGYSKGIAASHELKLLREEQKERILTRQTQRMRRTGDRSVWTSDGIKAARAVPFRVQVKRRQRAGQRRLLLELRTPLLVGSNDQIPWYSQQEWPNRKNLK
jgi:hypothetical protein